MRLVVGAALLCLGTSAARAEEVDGIAVASTPPANATLHASAAAGGGAQGSAIYGGLDLRLDLGWRAARVGLGGRLVWLDGHLRDDWTTPADALHLIRDLEVAGHVGETQLALAAGGLAPTELAHVADGYRARLDDRPVTGVRAVAVSRTVDVRGELDDVVHPHFVGGALAWQVAAPWGVQVAVAADPTTSDAAVEVAGQRRWERQSVRTDLGTGMVVEPGFGLAALAYLGTALDHGGARWTTTTQLLAGSGTVGGAFGPLQRIERTALYAHTHAGLGAAFTAGVVGRPGWASAGLRLRPGLGFLAHAAVGAPISRRVQAAAWFASSKTGTAGAAAVRATWQHGLATTLELGRLYTLADAMPADASMPVAPRASLSAVAWLSIAN